MNSSYVKKKNNQHESGNASFMSYKTFPSSIIFILFSEIKSN